MKNSVIVFTALFVLLSSDSTQVIAQRGYPGGYSAILSNLRTSSTGAEVIKPGSGPGYTKAKKNFARLYKNVTAGTWIKVKDGFVVRFLLSGIRYTVLYDTKGNWSGLVKNYTEERLPKNIREIVKSKYYDYSIFYVDEMETNSTGDASVYIVHLEDKTSVKLVRVYNGEMDVWMEYVKG